MRLYRVKSAEMYPFRGIFLNGAPKKVSMSTYGVYLPIIYCNKILNVPMIQNALTRTLFEILTITGQIQ